MKIRLKHDVEAMNKKGEKMMFYAGQELSANEGKSLGRAGAWIKDRPILPRFNTFVSQNEYDVIE